MILVSGDYLKNTDYLLTFRPIEIMGDAKQEDFNCYLFDLFVIQICISSSQLNMNINMNKMCSLVKSNLTSYLNSKCQRRSKFIKIHGG